MPSVPANLAPSFDRSDTFDQREKARRMLGIHRLHGLDKRPLVHVHDDLAAVGYSVAVAVKVVVEARADVVGLADPVAVGVIRVIERAWITRVKYAIAVSVVTAKAAHVAPARSGAVVSPEYLTHSARQAASPANHKLTVNHGRRDNATVGVEEVIVIVWGEVSQSPYDVGQRA